MSYVARGSEIYYLHPERGTDELFITVHPTTDCTMTPEQQAVQLAKMMNGMVSAASAVAPGLGAVEIVVLDKNDPRPIWEQVKSSTPG